MASTKSSSLGVSSLDQDAKFWWHHTGRTLLNMLYQAGYDIESMNRNLDFFRSMSVPWMGQRPSTNGSPQTWRSYVTDDHSPIEYSWSWDGGQGKTPKIRYTIEAMGPDSGSVTDPYNQSASRKLLSKLCNYSPDIDLTIHNHFEKWLLPLRSDAATVNAQIPIENHRSSMFIASECQGSGATVKTYFMPMIKAVEQKQTRSQVLIQAIQSLKPEHSVPAFDSLIDFMKFDPLGSACEVEMVAIDCVQPVDCRIKIYLRSQETSWNKVVNLLTMNNTIHVSPQALSELRTIWALVLSLDPNFSPTASLPRCHRPEAGTFYCHYARPGDHKLRCKLYIPAKYYGQNDRAIAMGLEKYFQKSDAQREWVPKYWNVLEDMCAHRSLEQGCGLHSYISCEPVGDGLSVTSYFSPEIYHPDRWRVKAKL